MSKFDSMTDVEYLVRRMSLWITILQLVISLEQKRTKLIVKKLLLSCSN